MHANQPSVRFNQSFIERENENSIQRSAQTNIFTETLRNRSIKLFAFFIIFAIAVPILVFYFVIHRSGYEEFKYTYTCAVEPVYRIHCGNDNISADTCTEINGCYDPNSLQCYHSIPARYQYYGKCSNTTSEECIFKPSQSLTPFLSESLSELKLTITEIDADVLQITLHTSDHSYEHKNITNKNYRVELQNDLLGVDVFRVKNNDLILTTFRGPLITSDGYWEWTFQLTNEKLYGLGEIVIENTKTISKVIYKNKNDHNTIASFMAYLNGSFHGLVVEHEGPLEVSVLPSKLVTLKSLAGSRIVLNLFTGPTPKDVTRQQRFHKASNKSLPLQLWVLGAHICRDGKATLDSAIEEYKEFTANEATIQFASDCIHENLYTMLSEAKEDHDLENLIGDLQAKSHFVMSVPPQILKGNFQLYNKAEELNLLYKDKMGEILNGSYLEQEVAYPDFTHESINTWIEELGATLPASRVDGFVLRDNWPEEEIYVFSSDDYKFPYLTEALNNSLSKTIPWDALSSQNATNVQHIVKHNQYGASQVTAFRNNLDFDFMMTASYDYGVQDAALIQNVDISWSNLKKAITTTLYHSILANPLISIPVCGSTNEYNKKAQESLCIRWYLFAATLPLFRISSDWPRRDPSSLATGFGQNAARKALETRYKLLPYYYSVLSEDNPLIRPMFYDFHFDNETLTLDEQYMLGETLLVAQPILPALNHMRVYLPPSVETWYEFWGGKKASKTGWINVPVVESDWIMFVAQGAVIPMRNYKLPTIGSESRDDTFKLAVALNCSSSNICSAEGFLNLGTTRLTFAANKIGLIVGNIIQAGNDLGCNLESSPWPYVIENMIIYGIEEQAVLSNFRNVNLCEVTVDEIYIQYFEEK